MALLDFIKKKELEEIKSLKQQLKHGITIADLENDIIKKESIIKNLEKEILSMQSIKKGLLSSMTSSSSSEKITVDGFRSVFKELYAELDEGNEKDLLGKFIVSDLSIIDLAKTRFETIELERKVPIDSLVAVVGDDGLIGWESEKDVSSRLIIGKPRKRTEFYFSILAMMKNIID